ncbi:MAG: hypothetical protein ACKN9S_09890, partial [Pirellula sp.]
SDSACVVFVLWNGRVNWVLEGCRQEEVLARHWAIAARILNTSNTEQVARCQAPVRGALAMHANPADAWGQTLGDRGSDFEC